MNPSACGHQCLLYGGSPSRHIPAIGAAIRQNLKQNRRCMYFNRPSMIADLGLHLRAAGVDVRRECETGRLVLTWERPHLLAGWFDMDIMMRLLEEALHEAMDDGYTGLWASGDMAWEFGPQNDFSMLLEYELRLDAFFAEHPEFSGVCQYHGPSLPAEVVRQGLYSHPSLFTTERSSMTNPSYLSPELIRHCRSSQLDQKRVDIGNPAQQ
jgi:hypothetical protein